MPRQSTKRHKSRARGAGARANHDPAAHITSLGLKSEGEYRAWCRRHGFSGATNKAWQERRREREVARRDAKKAESAGQVDDHIKALGLETVEEYRAWCRDRGLSASLHKGRNQRRKERELDQTAAAATALTRLRQQTRRPRNTIARIFNGAHRDGLKADYLVRIRSVAVELESKPPVRNCFRELLEGVEKQGALLRLGPALPRLGDAEGNSFIDGLAALARHGEDWLRPPGDWKPDSRNPRRQFSSVARHLLARYEVPEFLDSVWFRGGAEEACRQQGWFKHIGGGGNIRTVELPLALNKSMAHCFPQAPASYTAEEALRYAQIVGQGGEEALVEAIVDTRLGASFEHEPFWASVIQFLVRHPMLDPDLVGPIVDFIQAQKFEPQEHALPGGGVERGEPPQPNFSMKSRSLPKLLGHVEEWHERLARDTRVYTGGSWAPSGIGALEWLDEEDPAEPVRWTIHEILGGRELVAEGKAMNHCVASYVNNCRRGNTSIWSMQAQEAKGRPHQVMTIAVQSGGRHISQARGRRNALPRAKDEQFRRLQASYKYYLRRSRHVLNRWMEQEGLTMGRRV